MYKISVPININTLTEENRDELVRTLKKCEVQRVFLCGGLSFSLAERFEKLKKVKEYAAFFNCYDDNVLAQDIAPYGFTAFELE